MIVEFFGAAPAHDVTVLTSDPSTDGLDRQSANRNQKFPRETSFDKRRDIQLKFSPG
jgi:hypothetical protein